MASSRSVDPAQLRAAVLAVSDWLRGAGPDPARPELAAAVRATLRTLAQDAPGHTVEVRVPPYAAVQCIEGPRHTRGTPPTVVETDARTWLELATGLLDWDDALRDARVTASGSRADLAHWLPVVRI